MESENEIFEKSDEKIEEDAAIELIKEKKIGFNVKTSDIITMQCIICLIISILFVISKILFPEVLNEISKAYKNQITVQNDMNGTLMTIAQKISDFLNSTPNDRI